MVSVVAFALLVCAASAEEPGLIFQEGSTECEISLASGSLNSNCGLVIDGEDLISKIDAVEAKIMTEINAQTIKITADTWCAAKTLFKGNTHAVEYFHEETTAGGHAGQTCTAICLDRSASNYYSDTKYDYQCLGGFARIAPDMGDNTNHASYYWSGGCDTTLGSTNGHVFCCCAGHGESTVDKLSALQSADQVTATVTAAISAQASITTAAIAAQAAITTSAISTEAEDKDNTQTIKITADTWCAAKTLFQGNTHAVEYFHEETTAGGHAGQTCTAICLDRSASNYYSDTKYDYQCLGGFARIAPDMGDNTNHASYYWRGGCDTTLGSTNGHVFCCCAGHGESTVDKLSALQSADQVTATVTAAVSAQASVTTSAISTATETKAMDVLADSWCAAKGGWTSNTHAVNSAAFYGETCDTICEGSDTGLSTTWSCLAGNVRIAPDWASSGSHSAHASFYWNYPCSGVTQGNGPTYCCCVA